MTKLRAGCKGYYSGGGYVCDHCGFTWDYEDPEPPECKPIEHPKNYNSVQIARENLKEMRRVLK